MFKSPLFWIVGAFAVGVFLFKHNSRPFAGLVLSGWGGNWTGNLPTLINPRVIVGDLSNGQPIYGPPAATPTNNSFIGQIP